MAFLSDSVTSLALWGVRKVGRGEENVVDDKGPGFRGRGKKTRQKNGFFQTFCLLTRDQGDFMSIVL